MQVERGESGSRQRPLILEAPLVRSHHENLDGRLLADAVVHPLEPVVVPPHVEIKAVVGCVLTEIDGPVRVHAIHRVGPGPDDDLGSLPGGGRASLFPKPVQIPPAFEQQIAVPAVDEVGGSLDEMVLVPNSVRLPVLVIGGMLDPFLDVGQFHDVVQGGDQRQTPINLVVVEKRITRVDACDGGLQHSAGTEEAGRDHDVELEHAIVVDMAEIGLLAGAGDHAQDMGTLQGSRHQLRESVVGMAEEADFSVAPALLRHPLLGVVAVLRFVHVEFELAVRIVAASNVHHDHRIAPAGEVQGHRHVPLGPVIAAQEQCGKFSGRVRAKDIGREIHPVAHGNLEVDLGLDAILRLRPGFL